MAKQANPEGVVAGMDRASFAALMEAANRGDPAALAKLRSTLRQNPSIAETVGDLALMTRQALCASIVPNRPAMGEVYLQKAEALGVNLRAGSNCPIVALAVDRVVLTWLALNRLEIRYADATEMPAAEATTVVKAKLAAERAHQSALRTLATVRQLTGDMSPPVRGTSRRDPSAQLNVVGD